MFLQSILRLINSKSRQDTCLLISSTATTNIWGHFKIDIYIYIYIYIYIHIYMYFQYVFKYVYFHIYIYGNTHIILKYTWERTMLMEK